ncbi:MAG TPA: two-component system response regulator GlrR, partial [Methylophilaceae bacterium]|nr:two-component system response regulator GlrR [Methylophilaceae bacterium]
MNIATILIVDDDQDILTLISMRLKSAGYHTITANDGAQALSVLNIERPHLIISDLRMPSIDGMTLMQRVHQVHPTLPFIILTAHGSIPEAVNATQQGAFSFLAKPFESQVLLQQV